MKENYFFRGREGCQIYKIVVYLLEDVVEIAEVDVLSVYLL